MDTIPVITNPQEENKMDRFIDKNVENILTRLESLFTDKIVPYVQKTLIDQKDNMVSDLLSQVENSFIRETNGDEASETENVEPHLVKVFSKDRTANDFPDGNFRLKVGNYQYDYMVNPDMLDYNHEYITTVQGQAMTTIKNLPVFNYVRKIKTERGHPDWNDWVKNWKYATDMFDFIDNLREGEYIICLYIDDNITSYSCYHVLVITSFGSIYIKYFGNDHLIYKNNNEIPKSVLDIFMHNFLEDYPISSHSYYANVCKKFINFIKSVTEFQNWWKSRPLVGHTAELLKEENQRLMLKIHETELEHEKIKHMYETLELKEQYYKAVELLQQNKKERDLLERERAEFNREKEDHKTEMDEKLGRYNKYKDLDAELIRLAYIKKKLEREKRDFEEERDNFEKLKDELSDM